ncbi:uncharacterized protein LOC129324320 [Eublepharis macularius]|uniref:Uncharacterized protein LOC129324320 n=1 Tax=Eublepharis macularius TaxID=481883 RepID=A0AA97IXM0_EUBMA|nr:uncharacterized protein LOC129324320 [Eublepharis macularius]
MLIYTADKESHVELVRKVLSTLIKHKLPVKLSKCEFHKEELDYLGYRISSQGLKMDPAKVQALESWEAPQTRRQLQSFLGFANFYRPFIENFTQIALPVTDLLKTKGKGGQEKSPQAKLQWTPECQQAFEKLKVKFVSEPMLQHSDENRCDQIN